MNTFLDHLYGQRYEEEANRDVVFILCEYEGRRACQPSNITIDKPLAFSQLSGSASKARRAPDSTTCAPYASMSKGKGSAALLEPAPVGSTPIPGKINWSSGESVQVVLITGQDTSASRCRLRERTFPNPLHRLDKLEEIKERGPAAEGGYYLSA